MSTRKIIALVVTVAVAAAAVGGLIIAGTPSRERARQFDSRRINDLQQITNAIDQYWTRSKALPATLAELQNRREYFIASISDPRTGEPYEYRETGEKTYELCAVFETDESMADVQAKAPRPYHAPNGADFWRHGQGRVCYTIEAQTVPGLVPVP